MKKLNSGSSLVAVMITVAFFSAMIGVIVSVTRTQTFNSERVIARSQAVAYGDAIVESLFDQWRETMLNSTDALDRKFGRTQAHLAATLKAPTTAEVPAPKGISLNNWEVKAVNPMLQPTTRADGRPDLEQGTTNSLRTRAIYLARVVVNFPGSGGTTETVTLERPFVRAGKTLFDNFFFGMQPDVEFHPGQPMYVDGTVYVGGNLLTAHNNLHFMKDVAFLGEHQNNYHKNDSRFGSDPDIDNAPNYLADNWDSNNPPASGNEQRLFDTTKDSLDATDGNKDNDNYHELLEEREGDKKEDPLQLDTHTSERLAENADYRITVDKDNNLTISKWDADSEVNKPLAPTDSEYIALSNAITLNQAMNDSREAGYVRMVTMDVGKISDAAKDGKIKDNRGADGFMIYVKDNSHGKSVDTVAPGVSGTVKSSKRGVKLVNGGTLPSTGLTIATPNPAYVHGDYNSGKNGALQPPSNTASGYTPPYGNDGPPKPEAGDYKRAPAAIAADAINILSNKWNDANTGAKTASNTTVNAALIAGNVPTVKGGSYSGGVENFVRFHEDWGGKYLTIHGTQALLYNSEEATGPWSKASYSPPNRRWFYDTNFQNVNPPGFRPARSYQRGPWVSR